MTRRREMPRLRVEFVQSAQPVTAEAAQALYDDVQRELRKLLLDAGIDLAAVASTMHGDLALAVVKPTLMNEEPT